MVESGVKLSLSVEKLVEYRPQRRCGRKGGNGFGLEAEVREIDAGEATFGLVGKILKEAEGTVTNAVVETTSRGFGDDVS